MSEADDELMAQLDAVFDGICEELSRGLGYGTFADLSAGNKAAAIDAADDAIDNWPEAAAKAQGDSRLGNLLQQRIALEERIMDIRNGLL